MSNKKNDPKKLTLNICMTALFMAMIIALSSFGLPVPGGNIYLCDMPVYMAAMLLNPVLACIAGGFGTLLGDMIFYPDFMFVSLIVHGLQALTASLICRFTFKKHPAVASGIAVVVGGAIMVLGYVFGKAFLFGDIRTAFTECPFDILQTGVGGVLAMLLVYKAGVKKIFDTKINK